MDELVLRRMFVVEENGNAKCSNGWYSISHRLFESAGSRRSFRNRWYRIQSSHGVIYRTLKFSPQLTGSRDSEESEIALDWDGYLILWGGEGKRNAKELLISPASPLALVACAWFFPDPAIRVGIQLAIVLGGASLVLTLVGIALQFLVV